MRRECEATAVTMLKSMAKLKRKYFDLRPRLRGCVASKMRDISTIYQELTKLKTLTSSSMLPPTLPGQPLDLD